MKKELMYVAPEAEVLSAQVEAGFAASKPGMGETGDKEIW